MKKVYFVIDFDSTFVKVEALDNLAEIVLKKHPQKTIILNKIKTLTNDGMNGTLAFDESLKKRLALFKPTKKHIKTLITALKKNITPSIERNKEFFEKKKDNIYIISGGFKDYIYPLFKPLGISHDHILANTFIFDKTDTVIDFDHQNYLAQAGGKVKQMQKLNLPGKIYVIGDGYTDYQIKEAGLADKFFAFTENVRRDTVIQKADYLLPNFDEFLYLHHLPRAYSYPKSRIKVLLLENIHPVAVQTFKNEGYDVESIPQALSEKDLTDRIKDISILGIRSKTQITPTVLSNAHKLLSIGAYCIGTNQINLKKAGNQGIAVFNAPYSNTRSVVELIIGEIIMLSRQILDKSNGVHKGQWDKLSSNCNEIRGKKLGIIGYGNIGSQLSVLAENLGMRVYYYDVAEKMPLSNAYKCQSLEELLKVADIISIHVDGRESNRNLISKKQFELMKPGVLFLNASRGHIVDIDELKSSIIDGRIRGCAIDVFPKEPQSNKELFHSVLQGLPNVILTPHIGGSTSEAQQNIGEFVSKKIINFINEGTTTLSINMPNVQLPPLSHAHRLLHVHRNMPGVLAKINSILAQNNINIEGQYLKTTDDIGYVITDVFKEYNKIVIEELKDIAETIKFRILY